MTEEEIKEVFSLIDERLLKMKQSGDITFDEMQRVRVVYEEGVKTVSGTSNDIIDAAIIEIVNSFENR